MASPTAAPSRKDRVSGSTPLLVLPPVTRSNVPGAIAAAVAIAALYVHFLVFGELAFLNVVMVAVPKGKAFLFLSALGSGGVIGSLLCAYLYHGRTGKQFAGLGFLLCAVAAPLTLLAHSQATVIAAAVFSGLTLGWVTVSVALCLRPTLHGHKLGLICGLGTGAAYAICNFPLVLAAHPRTQIFISSGAAVVGLLATFRLRSDPYKLSGALDYRRATAAVWILVFTLLVWLDSAAFFVIQQTDAMRVPSWDANLVQFGNGFLYLTAAILAGLALDRHHFTTSIVTAAGLLVAASLILAGAPQHYAVAHVLYIGAAAIYSTALVYYPARSGRRWIAASLFAIGGWGGSALGVTMASRVHELPAWTVGVGALLLTAALITRKWTRGNEGEGLRF